MKPNQLAALLGGICATGVNRIFYSEATGISISSSCWGLKDDYYTESMSREQNFVLYLDTDDRFILKQIKSIEISAFVDFAPRYLEYINKALDETVK